MINNLLNLSALIEKKVINDPDADDSGNIELTWETKEISAKCYIYQYSEVSGNLVYSNVGYNPSNKFIGMFLSTCTIAIGDRVTIIGFPILYVDSFSSEINARLGITNHIQCLLKISAD